MDEVVGEDGAVGELGLADEVHGARVVEEEVMHQARPPGRDAVRAAETHVAHERVPAAVEVACVVIGAETIFLLRCNEEKWVSYLGSCEQMDAVFYSRV